MTFTTPLRFAALFIALLPLAPAEAQPRLQSEGQEESKEDEKPIERVSEWPAVEDKGALKKDVARLRKAHTEEMGTQAHQALVAMGASAAPALLVAFEKEKNEDARDRVLDVLELICDARHTRVLIAELDSKSERVRLYILHRVALFPDAGVHDKVRSHFDALVAKKDRAEPKELYAAALCLASSGDSAGMTILIKAASENWKKRGSELRSATVPLRGDSAALKALTAMLGEDSERADRVTALRLLASIGDQATAKRYFSPLLDQNDNSLRIAAVNACRGIFDGDPPLKRLPVFEAIETAKKWKARL